MQKKWEVKKYDNELLEKIKKRFNVSTIMAKFVVAREIEYKNIENFLYGKLEDLKDPYLIKDMDKLVERIVLAKENNEKICIYGDYDVDGITSIVVFYKFLKELDIDVSYYLPDRLTDGYGLNIKALDEIKQRGVSLIITVDCGITAIEEIEYAKELGMDVCVTDHHECGLDLPNAIAIVNPKQNDDKSYFKMHAGVGVVFKCICAIAKKYNLEEYMYFKYLDIVAIGTISDIVPLVDENRIISKYGLRQLKQTENVGIKALLNKLKYKDVDSIMVSFSMAPRINACGRMGDASIAVKLLLEEDEDKASEIAERLNELNVLRQEVEKNIFDQAVEMIQREKFDKNNSLVLYDKDWHNGVIGIVASRLVSIYNKPVILITKENNVLRGSGRCPIGFSLYEAASNCKDLLLQFGGHELAIGFSIEEEKIEAFRECFEKIASKEENIICEKIIDVDAEIFKEDLNSNLLRDVRFLKPYGQSNKAPNLLYKNLKVVAIRTLKDEKHLKFVLKDEKVLIEGIAFMQGERRDEILVGDKIDVVTQVDLNDFNGKKTLQFIIQDFKKSII